MIAIVGRPNVGKSTLFNALAGHRISIVEPTAGVTRDRVTAEITIDGHRVELVDTGGMGVVDDDTLSAHVAKQIELALGLANIIVFVVDIRTGLAPLDILVGKCLRKLQKPLLLVANKADHAQLEAEAGEFHKLGFGEPMRISAQHQRGVTTVKERLEELLSANDRPEGDAPEVIKVAVVGKRNAGKSTFVNKLLGEERMIVSDVAGTTRDAVDCPFTLGGREFVAIDTAGLRRQRKVENAIEHFSLQRSHEAIERADVVIFMFDVTETISIVDKNLARVISDLHKPCVLVCNKWDLARERIDTGEFDGYVQKQLPELKYCPAVFICALENRGVRQALRTAEELYDQALEIVENAGLPQGFMGHQKPLLFVGHGVGLEIDEWPIVGKNSEHVLEEGMVIALEEKFIFPGEGVVGTENTYLVTRNRMEKLNCFPDDITVL